MKETKAVNQEAVFEKLPVPSALRVMVVPAVVSQLIVLIYNMADTFYVGQTGNPYMVAGTSLILPIFNITLCLAGLAGVGGGALISRLLGENKREEARRVSAFSLYLGICIAAVFSLGTGIFMRPLLEFLGAGENTYGYASQYAFCVIVLGAGIATCLSNCIACLFFLAVLARIGKESGITFSPRAGRPERESIVSVFSVGIPSAVSSFLFDVDYMIIDRLMVSYHDLALAAIGIVLKVERFPLNVGIGICQGMLPLVAYSYGARKKKRMDDTIRLARRTGLIIAGLSILLYELFAGQLIQVFISDAKTVELGTNFLRARVLATPLMFLSFFTVYLFQAFGRGEKSLFLGVARWLAFNIPMLFILNGMFGMYGIVWSQVTADTLTVLLSFYVYRKYKPKL